MREQFGAGASIHHGYKHRRARGLLWRFVAPLDVIERTAGGEPDVVVGQEVDHGKLRVDQVERRTVDFVVVATRREGHDALVVRGPERAGFVFLDANDPVRRAIEELSERGRVGEGLGFFVEEEARTGRSGKDDGVVDDPDVDPAGFGPREIFEEAQLQRAFAEGETSEAVGAELDPNGILRGMNHAGKADARDARRAFRPLAVGPA